MSAIVMARFRAPKQAAIGLNPYVLIMLSMKIPKSSESTLNASIGPRSGARRF